jgi:hypothetical protein
MLIGQVVRLGHQGGADPSTPILLMSLDHPYVTVVRVPDEVPEGLTPSVQLQTMLAVAVVRGEVE